MLGVDVILFAGLGYKKNLAAAQDIFIQVKVEICSSTPRSALRLWRQCFVSIEAVKAHQLSVYLED